eukprot:1236414-Pleurochrysis_carterae.AAC.3
MTKLRGSLFRARNDAHARTHVHARSLGARRRCDGRAGTRRHECRMSQPAQSKSHGSYEVGDFDMYLLAQTWAAQFCCVKAERCSTVPWAFSAHHLSLHGLWPGFYSPRDNETYPAECATKAKLLTDQLPREYIDMAPAFTKWNVEKHYAEVIADNAGPKFQSISCRCV